MLLAQTVRSLRRAPIFAAASITTLALGIGASAAIFSLVDVALIEPLPYRDSDRLVALTHSLNGIGIPSAGQSLGTYFLYRRLSRTLADVAAYVPTALNVATPESPGSAERVRGVRITQDLLTVLGVGAQVGRTFTTAEDEVHGDHVAILSNGLSRQWFGTARAAVGRSIDIEGVRFTVVGVMPEAFHFPDYDTDLWLPLQLDSKTPYAAGFSLAGIGRLARGATPESAMRELNELLPRLPEQYPNLYESMPTAPLLSQARARAVVRTMKDATLGGFGRVLWIALGAVALVLLVACANVANLVFVRIGGRSHEIATRSALGATVARSFAPFLAETAILTAVGAVVGLGLAAAGLSFLVQSNVAQLPRLADARIDLMTIATTAGVALLAVVLSGVLPIAQLARSDVTGALRVGGRGGLYGRSASRAQEMLVATQVALALVLLAGSGLLIRSVLHLRDVKTGFDPAHTLAFNVSAPATEFAHAGDVQRFIARMVDKLDAMPSVSAAGATSKLPLTGGEALGPVYVEDFPVVPPRLPPVHPVTFTTRGYSPALGIPLVTGRVFGPPDDDRDAHDVLASRAFAKQYWDDSTGRRALGQRIRLGKDAPWLTIVGVVESVRDTSLVGQPAAQIYVPLTIPTDTSAKDVGRNVPTVYSIVVRSRGDAIPLANDARRIVNSLATGVPIYNVTSLSDVLGRATARTTFLLDTLGIASAITLILGAIGLYGVIAYTITLTSREIGLRMALGAQQKRIVMDVVARGVRLAGVGIAIGISCFLVVGRSLRHLLVDVQPTDPIALAGAALLLGVIALLASWFPARRAARIDPLCALRGD